MPTTRQEPRFARLLACMAIATGAKRLSPRRGRAHNNQSADWFRNDSFGRVVQTPINTSCHISSLRGAKATWQSASPQRRGELYSPRYLAVFACYADLHPAAVSSALSAMHGIRTDDSVIKSIRIFTKFFAYYNNNYFTVRRI